MGQFFRGWRRKAGVVTLLMACVFMTGWVRSFGFHDEVSFNTTELTDSLSSHLGCLYWMRVRLHRSDNLPFLKRFHWQNARLQALQVWKEEDAGLHWKWHFLGIGVRNLSRSNGEPYYSFFVITYWSIVLPLTLLSAILLLSKPRKSTPSKITEPIPEMVA